jgi:hypothetical protein
MSLIAIVAVLGGGVAEAAGIGVLLAPQGERISEAEADYAEAGCVSARGVAAGPRDRDRASGGGC